MIAKIPLTNLLQRIVFFLLLLGSTGLNAQLIPGTSGESKEGSAAEIQEDSLGRQTPRGTVSGFIQAMSDQNYTRASQYLELRKNLKKKEERERIVKIFQKLLDQGGNIMPYSWISNKGTGRTDDELAAGLDLVGTVTVSTEEINLYVENTGTDANAPLWRFSSDTVDKIAAIKGENEVLVNKVLPKVLQERLLGGVPVGHWLALIVLVVLSYLVAWAVLSLISLCIRTFWHKARTEPTSGIIEALDLPFRLYIAVWLFVALSKEVGISIIIRQRFSAITVTIGIVAFLILLWRMIDLLGNFSKSKMTLRGRISAISVIMFLSRTAKVAIVVFGIIAVLGAIGVDVTTGLAALGIGGIALALGAQKTVENFVGSVTLIVDQPIRIGDFCKVGDISGTVEQIGMRSTKIRTGERTIVTIPNGEFSSNKIENYAHRDRFLFTTVLGFRYETTPDQIRFLLVELRSILYAHPKVLPEQARVRFIGLGASELRIEVYGYITAPNSDGFLEVQEDLLLHIMEVVALSGTDFAFPSQTLYMATDSGISSEKAQSTADTVRSWKENNDLQLPNFTPEKIQQLKNTLPYPEEGSVSAVKNE